MPRTSSLSRKQSRAAKIQGGVSLAVWTKNETRPLYNRTNSCSHYTATAALRRNRRAHYQVQKRLFPRRLFELESKRDSQRIPAYSLYTPNLTFDLVPWNWFLQKATHRPGDLFIARGARRSHLDYTGSQRSQGTHLGDERRPLKRTGGAFGEGLIFGLGFFW